MTSALPAENTHLITLDSILHQRDTARGVRLDGQVTRIDGKIYRADQNTNDRFESRDLSNAPSQAEKILQNDESPLDEGQHRYGNLNAWLLQKNGLVIRSPGPLNFGVLPSIELRARDGHGHLYTVAHVHTTNIPQGLGHLNAMNLRHTVANATPETPAHYFVGID